MQPSNGQFLTPEDFELIMKSSTAPEQQQALQAQMAMAKNLRGEAPGMRGNGRVMVAQNPLEQLSYGIRDVMAMRSEKDALKMQKALIEELRKARMTYGRNVMQPDPTMPAGPQASGAMTYPVQ